MNNNDNTYHNYCSNCRFREKCKKKTAYAELAERVLTLKNEKGFGIIINCKDLESDNLTITYF